MTPLKEVGDLEAKSYAVWGRVAMILVELAIFGGIPFGVWIVILPRPFDYVAHGFHDGYALDGLYIEGILRDPSSDSWFEWQSEDCVDGLSSRRRLSYVSLRRGLVE